MMNREKEHRLEAYATVLQNEHRLEAYATVHPPATGLSPSGTSRSKPGRLR